MAKDLVRQPFWGKKFLEYGLNLTDNAIMVPFQNMVEALNIMVGSTWARRKRPGLAYWNVDDSDETVNYPVNPKNNSGVDGDPIRGLTEFWRYDSGPGIIISDLFVRQDDVVYSIDGRSGAATVITGPALQTTGRISTQVFDQKLYWCSTNFGEGLNVWDGGATYIAHPDPPTSTPSILTTYRDRLVAMGLEDEPYTVWFSEIGNADNFNSGTSAKDPTSFSLDFSGDPDGITGGVEFQGRLFVFLRRSIYQVTGTDRDDLASKLIVRGVGAINSNCIVPVGNDVFFLAERGLMSLRSTDKAVQSEYGYMSRDIAKLYNEQLDRSLEGQWSMEYDERENLLYISVTSKGSTENDTILVYNTEKDLWTYFNGVDARTLTKVLIEGTSRVLAGREDGILALMGEDERRDFGDTDYVSEFLTGIYYPGDSADIEHVFEEVTVLCSASESAELTIQVSIDEVTIQTETLQLTKQGGLLGSTFVLGSSALTKGVFTPKTVQIQGKGFGLQIRMSYPSSKDVEVYGFIIGSRPAGQRRYQ